MVKVQWFLRIEGLLLFILAVALFAHYHIHFIFFLLLLFVPDISMIGYLKDKKVGALVYNAGHTLTLPYVLALVAMLTGNRLILGLAIIWLAHIGMDRFFGYGLKLDSGFKDTSLGKISN